MQDATWPTHQPDLNETPDCRGSSNMSGRTAPGDVEFKPDIGHTRPTAPRNYATAVDQDVPGGERTCIGTRMAKRRSWSGPVVRTWRVLLAALIIFVERVVIQRLLRVPRVTGASCRYPLVMLR